MHRRIVNMNIAELVVTQEPVVVCTVLGSCVSVCLFADNIQSESSLQKIGEANVAIARRILESYKIPIVGEDVGGETGRKILFHVQTGRLQTAFFGPGYLRPSASSAIHLPHHGKKTGT